MQVRFGYVAIALNLKDCSTSKTITLTNLQKMPDQASKKLRLQRLLRDNLSNTLRVIRYNQAEHIHVYRLTSKLVPFATYPLEFAWDYITEFAGEFAALGTAITESGLRLSAHPDHFTVINSPDEKVFADSVKDLIYHERVMAAMGLGEHAKLVVHVGGSYGDKQGSIDRFKQNLMRLPQTVRARLVLENDDKLYTAQDVLQVCQACGLPMVLDLHHHLCNPGGELVRLLPDIWQTWGEQLPKIHVSSPKDAQKIRHHADYVEADSVSRFLELARELNRDFDVVVEAKKKDQAMFKLVDDLSHNEKYTRLDATTLVF